MPCYDGRLTSDEIEAKLRSRAREEALRRNDLQTWYLLTPRHHVEQWLCDAIMKRELSEDARRWFACHRKFVDG